MASSHLVTVWRVWSIYALDTSQWHLMNSAAYSCKVQQYKH